MQAVSPLSPASKFVGKERFAEIYGKLNNDFGSKLKVGFIDEEEEEKEKYKRNNLEKSWCNNEECDVEAKREEFSFASVNAENSPITAEDAFEGGQIRSFYPLYNRNLIFNPEEISLHSPLKKLFVESEEATAASSLAEEEISEPMGPYCSWSSRVEEVLPDTCRKSNSTGFSKLWRFRDLVLRSNSDGKDAFVFLNNGDKNHSSSITAAKKLSGVKKTEKRKEKTKLEKTMKTTTAHERLYMRNRAIKEEEKRRSYLPYKHVGFFTNVNGFTRNVHPF